MTMDSSFDRNSREAVNSASSHSSARAPRKIAVIVPIYMVLVVLPVQLSIGPIVMNGPRLIALVFIIPLLFNLLSGKYGRLVWPDILLLAFCLWSFVALFVNNPDSAIQFAGSQLLELYGGYLVGRAFVRSEDDLIFVIKLLGIIVTFSVPFGLFEAITGRSLVLEILRHLPVVGVPAPGVYGERMGIQRSQFVFTHPIHYGLYSSIIFTLALIGLKNIVSTRLRIIFAAASFLGVIFSMSSGALLYLVIQILLMAWAAAFKSTKYRWMLLYISIAIIYVAIDLASDRTPMKVFMSYATFSAHNAYYRSIIFEWGMTNIWSSPIFGIGLNDWVRPAWMASPSVDNFWLLMTMRFGIPAFFLLVGGYILALWKIGRTPIDPDSTVYRLRRAWMFTFVGITFTLTTVHIWWSVFSFVFFLFGTGIWFGEQRSTTANKGDAQPHDGPDATDASKISREGRSPGTIRYTRFPNHQQY